MPTEVRPAALAALLELSERPRVGDWSLRAALVRYAQPEPVRVSQVMELVRRIDAALHPHQRLLVERGDEIWAAVEAGELPDSHPERIVVGALVEARRLDEMADLVAAWADDRSRPKPDAEIDAAVSAVATRLDDLGVLREERRPPPGARRRG